MLEKLKGYKTVVFNMAMPVIMLLAAMGVLTPEEIPSTEMVQAFFDNLEAVLGGIWGVVNVALRAVTTGPIGTKS